MGQDAVIDALNNNSGALPYLGIVNAPENVNARGNKSSSTSNNLDDTLNDQSEAESPGKIELSESTDSLKETTPLVNDTISVKLDNNKNEKESDKTNFSPVGTDTIKMKDNNSGFENKS